MSNSNLPSIISSLLLVGKLSYVACLHIIPETGTKVSAAFWDLDFSSDAEDFQENNKFIELPDTYLHHMRKAGGTTMRRWMAKVCKERGHEPDCAYVVEGGAITKKRDNELFGDGSLFKVRVVHLREPVARAQSLINMNLEHTIEGCPDPEVVAKQSLNCSAQTVDRQISLTSCHSTPSTENGNIPFWNCIDDFYVKSLVGTNERNPAGMWDEVTEDDFNTAKQRLAEFDAVLITEWMQFNETAEFLSKDVFHLNHTIPFDGAPRHELYYKFDDQQWSQIEQRNQWDRKLFQYAKELAFKRMMDAGYGLPDNALS